MQPGYTWENWRTHVLGLYYVHGKDKGRAAWYLVMIEDDKEILQDFLAKTNTSGTIKVSNFGRVLKSGWGKDPPSEIKEMINDQYVNYMYKISKVRDL